MSLRTSQMYLNNELKSDHQRYETVSNDDNCVSESGPQIIASKLMSSPWVPETQCIGCLREGWEGRVSSREDERGEFVWRGEFGRGEFV